MEKHNVMYNSTFGYTMVALSSPTDICTLPRVVGPCSGSFSQFYYDHERDQCFQFDYGGCQGNKNRYAIHYFYKQT